MYTANVNYYTGSLKTMRVKYSTVIFIMPF